VLVSEEGIPISFNFTGKAGVVISKLNTIGAEFEVFSNNG
jgi:hypothetical protein